MEAGGARASQACAACKRRKVKCDGQPRCTQCTHLNLKCEYSQANPGARIRRNISRGAVINEIKGEPSSARRSPQVASQPSLSPQQYSPQQHTPPAFENAYFHDLVAQYSTRLFPFIPVIPVSEFVGAIEAQDQSPETGAFVHALAAVTMNMSRVGLRHPAENKIHVTQLYTRSLELRGLVMPKALVTLHSVMIPFLVSICLFSGRQNVDMGFYYLREAITRGLILERNQSARTDASDTAEREQFLRLYWVLFIHERYVAISHHRQILLPPIQQLPTADNVTEAQIIQGFSRVIDHFRVVDSTFVSHWLDRDRNCESITIPWISQKQAELGTDMDAWEHDIASLDDSSRIDLMITRYWLHTSIWQLALSKFLLTSTAERSSADNFMSIIFPVQLAHRLRYVLAVIPPEIVETHGTGIVQKIFDITVTTADILVFVPEATFDRATTKSHLDNYILLYQFLLEMASHYPVEEGILRTKLVALQQRYPSLHFDDTR